AQIACSACKALGVAITTPSRSAANSSSKQLAVAALGASLAAWARISAELSQMNEISAIPLSAIRCIRCSPIQPVPRKPRRGQVAILLLLSGIEHQRFVETAGTFVRCIQRRRKAVKRKAVGEQQIRTEHAAYNLRRLQLECR